MFFVALYADCEASSRLTTEPCQSAHCINVTHKHNSRTKYIDFCALLVDVDVDTLHKLHIYSFNNPSVTLHRFIHTVYDVL
jgi:hypothetical protein